MPVARGDLAGSDYETATGPGDRGNEEAGGGNSGKQMMEGR